MTMGDNAPSQCASVMTRDCSITSAIGNTPLIRLTKASEMTGCDIFGKAEFLNPGQSVKDRAAVQMITDAEGGRQIERGGTIVEGTAGNTGIGLAIVGRTRGYAVKIVMPDTQSHEKKDALKILGAEVVEVPAAPFSDPANYQHVAQRLSEELRHTATGGVLFANQWNNLSNPKAHYTGMGPEIWRQTEGRIHGFICAVGTGGTLAGTSAFLRERNPSIKIGLADPPGAAMYSLFTTGVANASSGSSIIEGIGLGRVTPIVKEMKIDFSYQIPDVECLPLLFELAHCEGLWLGGSSAINVAGAIRLAKDLGPGHCIVTVLCDVGTRYMSKLFNAEYLRAKNLPTPKWLRQ